MTLTRAAAARMMPTEHAYQKGRWHHTSHQAAVPGREGRGRRTAVSSSPSERLIFSAPSQSKARIQALQAQPEVDLDLTNRAHPGLAPSRLATKAAAGQDPERP
jgi:hypothetical protein